MDSTDIEPVAASNLDEVLPLIRLYQEFYRVADISDERNRQFFSRFGKDNPLGCQFLFRRDGKAVAFATVYFSFTSALPAKVAVLNDLYTLPEARRHGIGRKLTEHCREYARESGAVRLQWLTASDNQVAQRLYDSLETGKSNWVFYTYPV